MAGIVAFHKNKRTWFGEIQCNDPRRDLGSVWNCTCLGSTAGELREKRGERRGILGGMKQIVLSRGFQSTWLLSPVPVVGKY